MDKNKLKKFLPLVLGLLVFSYLAIYILPLNIHGDGFTHALVAQEMAETKTWVEHIPHSLISLEDGEKVYAPIQYPETSHILMAVFYRVGGEVGLKFYSIVLGAAIAVLVFLLLKDVHLGGAFLAGAGVVVFNAKRFIMTPLIEPFLLFNLVAFFYFYFNYHKKRKIINLIFSGLFLGLFFASKHIAVYIYLLIIFITFIYYVYQSFKSKKLKNIYPFFIILCLSLVISAGPIYNQIQRVGTIGYGYGTTQIPKFIPFHDPIQKTFFQSKIQQDPEVANETDQLLSYRVRELSLYKAYERYVLFPVFYESKVKSNIVFWLFCFSTFFLVGIFTLYKKNKYLSISLLVIFLSEFIVTYQLKQSVSQYHVAGIATLMVFLSFGFITFFKYFRKIFLQKTVIALFLAVFLAQLTLGYYYYAHSRFWQREGRQTDQELGAYKEMGEFVKNNTPEDAVIMASGNILGKYGDRDVIWHGARAYSTFKSEDKAESFGYLNDYNIDYIMINNVQTERSGVYDYLPPDGFLPELGRLDCFKKVNSVDFLTEDDYQGNLSLYKYDYSPSCLEPSSL